MINPGKLAVAMAFAAIIVVTPAVAFWIAVTLAIYLILSLLLD